MSKEHFQFKVVRQKRKRTTRVRLIGDGIGLVIGDNKDTDQAAWPRKNGITLDFDRDRHESDDGRTD
jgi:hypothetical protein